ncbi:MAG: hypothetical protein IT406_03380 [Candidatus Yanofskybacteria bacterium]|nr:hypothetical protein [Candidatus Yanofskybacteria bacterium]
MKFWVIGLNFTTEHPFHIHLKSSIMYLRPTISYIPQGIFFSDLKGANCPSSTKDTLVVSEIVGRKAAVSPFYVCIMNSQNNKKTEDEWGLLLIKHNPRPNEKVQSKRVHETSSLKEDLTLFLISIIVGVPTTLIFNWLLGYAWGYLIAGGLGIFILLPLSYIFFTRGIRIYGHLVGSKKLKKFE